MCKTIVVSLCAQFAMPRLHVLAASGIAALDVMLTVMLACLLVLHFSLQIFKEATL